MCNVEKHQSSNENAKITKDGFAETVFGYLVIYYLDCLRFRRFKNDIYTWKNSPVFPRWVCPRRNSFKTLPKYCLPFIVDLVIENREAWFEPNKLINCFLRSPAISCFWLNIFVKTEDFSRTVSSPEWSSLATRLFKVDIQNHASHLWTY